MSSLPFLCKINASKEAVSNSNSFVFRHDAAISLIVFEV
jgi:hypothetical protein